MVIWWDQWKGFVCFVHAFKKVTWKRILQHPWFDSPARFAPDLWHILRIKPDLDCSTAVTPKPATSGAVTPWQLSRKVKSSNVVWTLASRFTASRLHGSTQQVALLSWSTMLRDNWRKLPGIWKDEHLTKNNLTVPRSISDSRYQTISSMDIRHWMSHIEMAKWNKNWPAFAIDIPSRFPLYFKVLPMEHSEQVGRAARSVSVAWASKRSHLTIDVTDRKPATKSPFKAGSFHSRKSLEVRSDSPLIPFSRNPIRVGGVSAFGGRKAVMRNVDMSNGQHLTAVQDSKDFDSRSEKLGLKNGYPLCFSLFSLWRMLKYLVLWITAGGTDLDQTKAISCRSKAWRSVQDLMWDVVETRIVVSSELSVLQELVETESAECPLGIATALAIFGAFQPIDDYLNFLEEILQDILTILPTEMLSVLLKSEFPFFGALDWLSDHKLWGSKSNVGCLDREHGEQGTVSVHSRQFQSVLRHHLDGPKGTPPLPTIAAVEFLMKQGSKERIEREKGQGMGWNCLHELFFRIGWIAQDLVLKIWFSDWNTWESSSWHVLNLIVRFPVTRTRWLSTVFYWKGCGNFDISANLQRALRDRKQLHRRSTSTACESGSLVARRDNWTNSTRGSRWKKREAFASCAGSIVESRMESIQSVAWDQSKSPRRSSWTEREDWRQFWRRSSRLLDFDLHIPYRGNTTRYKGSAWHIGGTFCFSLEIAWKAKDGGFCRWGHWSTFRWSTTFYQLTNCSSNHSKGRTYSRNEIL